MNAQVKLRYNLNLFRLKGNVILKKSFSILELIFIIILIGIINSQVSHKNNLSKIKLAKQQLILHLKYVRYIAMVDNKYDKDDPLWFRKRWTVKFLNCNKTIGGIYYIIYSDENKNGYISKDETLKDPLTNSYIYSYQCKEDKIYDKNNLVLLTKQYDITNIDISCNSTTTIGQFSFGNNGEVYTRLSTNENKSEENRLNTICKISIYDKFNNQEIIEIHPITGQIEE